MPSADAIHWETRYRSEPRLGMRETSPFLVENAHLLPPAGKALDVAMGAGANAGFLLAHGLDIVGVDISMTALRIAKSRWPGIHCFQADLTHVWLPPSGFDLIINFYYLQRDLWAEYGRILKPGGLLILETLTREMLAIKPEMDPAYLLAPAELADLFREWEILSYHEGWIPSSSGGRKAVAGLVARNASR